MTTALFSLIILYILYYSGMISYDLFIKKPSQLAPAPEIQFVLSPDAVENSPKSVEVDDADVIVTPSSFETDLDTLSDSTTSDNAETVLETLRDQFDEENDLADVEHQSTPDSVIIDHPIDEPKAPVAAEVVEPDLVVEDVDELRDLFEEGGTISEPLPNSKPIKNGQSEVTADSQERKDLWARRLWLASQRITCVKDMEGEKVFALNP